MNGADFLTEITPARILEVGFPGGGKTGALAALLNSGFKVRLLNFEGKNYKSLIAFTKPEMLVNLDIINVSDKIVLGDRFFTLANPAGPTAFAQGIKYLQRWKYKNKDGTETDLGPSSDWGPDTVVVVDSLTGQGEAGFRRAVALSNKTPLNMTQQVWGFAANDQTNFIKVFCAEDKSYNAIMTAHLSVQSPDNITKDDEEKHDGLAAEKKEDLAAILPTRMYPKGTTKDLSRTIAKEFNCMIQCEKIRVGNKEKRIIRTQGQEFLDLKVPARNVPETLPIETGLATIFGLLGIPAPLEA